MKKIYFYVKFLFVTFLIVGSSNVFAATNTWDFSTPADYTISDEATVEISSDVGRLKGIPGLFLTSYTSGVTTVNDVVISPDGDTAYVSAGANGLIILNISDPSNPVLITSYIQDVSYLSEVDISPDGNTLYLRDANNYYLFINVTNPATPSFLGTYNGTGDTAISPDGDTLYRLAGGKTGNLSAVDVSDPANPVAYAGGIGVNTGTAITISADGNTAYYISNTQGLVIVDISNLSIPFPVIASTLDGYASSSDIVVSNDGNSLFIAGESTGLRIVDITTPASPSLISTLDTSGIAEGVSVSSDENTAYIADSADGLQIIDITDPAHPSLINTIDTDGSAKEVVTSPDGNYVYIADDTGGLDVISLADGYASDSPYITPTTSQVFSSTIDSFSHTLGSNNEGTITYQLSTDDGNTWYYWDGGSWIETSADDGTETSTVTEVNTNIATLDTDGGDFLFRAYLNSDGTEQVELDEVTVDGSFTAFIITMTTPSTNTTVPNNDWFPVTFSVECTQGDCGDIDLTLDPIGTFYFEKTDFGSEEDCITDNVCITRGNSKGIYNSVLESGYDDDNYESPFDTEWAAEACGEDPASLEYDFWRNTVNANPLDYLEVPLCMHLITDDVYIDIEFQSWTSSANGGGFSYYRTTTGKGIIPTTPTEPFYTNAPTNPVTVTVGEGQTVDYTFNVYANGTVGEAFEFFGFGQYASGGSTYVESERYTITLGEEEEEEVTPTASSSSTKKSSRRLTQAQVDQIFGTVSTSSIDTIRKLQIQLISLLTQLIAIMKG